MNKLVLIIPLLFVMGSCTLNGNNNNNNLIVENSTPIDNSVTESTNTSGVNETLDPECNVGSDCILVIQSTLSSCYYPCKLVEFPCTGDSCLEPCTEKTPRCSIVPKKNNYGYQHCEIGRPCVEPKVIKCINHQCVGEW